MHLQLFSQRVAAGLSRKSGSVLFIHNFCFSSQAIARLISKINEVRLSCIRQPDKHSMVLICDFILAPKGSSKMSLLYATASRNTQLSTPPSFCQSAEKIVQEPTPRWTCPCHLMSAPLPSPSPQLVGCVCVTKILNLFFVSQMRDD